VLLLRSERENLCEKAKFTGWDVHGGYASHIAVRADFALRIPEGSTTLLLPRSSVGESSATGH